MRRSHACEERAPRRAADSAEREAALQSLTMLERRLLAREIARQFAQRPRRERELMLYGVKGATQLYAGAAMVLGMLVLVVPIFISSIIGQRAVAVPLYTLMLILLVASLVRLAIAARTGRAWRRSRCIGPDSDAA